MPDPRMPVDARGTLRIDAPTGRSLDLLADGDTLRLELPGWPEARAMMPRSFSGRARALERLGRLLNELGLVLSLESAGNPVLRLGHGVSANWLGRLFGGASANISLSAISLIFRR